LKAPKGFKTEVYASGLANARTLRQGDKGTVFVSTRLLDKVYAINEQAGRREVKTLYSWHAVHVIGTRCSTDLRPRSRNLADGARSRRRGHRMTKRRACVHDGNTGRKAFERLPKSARREGQVRGIGLGLGIARDILGSHGRHHLSNSPLGGLRVGARADLAGIGNQWSVITKARCRLTTDH
jgi:hypothetical protein